MIDDSNVPDFARSTEKEHKGDIGSISDAEGQTSNRSGCPCSFVHSTFFVTATELIVTFSSWSPSTYSNGRTKSK